MGSTVAGGVSVVFSAETAAFTASVKRADDAIGASARSMEAASTRLERAWNRELLAQDRVAERTQQTARAKELAALKTDILARSEEQSAQAAARSELSYTRLIQALTNAGSMTNSLTTANRELAASQEMVAASAQHTVPAMAASSGALRLLEGNFNNNIRAAERFLGTTLGLGPLLEAAFPIVGAIALTGALVKMGTEAYQAEMNFVHLKSAIEGLNEIQITVDKKVGAAADSIEEKIESILEKNSGKTIALQQKYTYQSAKPVDLSEYFYDDKFKKLPDDVKTNYEKTYKSIAPQDLPDRLASIRKEVTALKDALDFSSKAGFGMVVTKVNGFGPDTGRDYRDYYKARLLAAQQIQAQVEAESNLRGASLQGVQIDTTDAQQKEAEDKQRKAEEAARKHDEALRRASAALLRGMDQARQAEEQQGKLGAQADLDYWTARIGAFEAGSNEFGVVQKKITEDQKSLARSAQQFNEEQAHGAEVTAKNAGSLAIANIQLDLASHLITKVAADQRIGAIQAEEYTAKLQALRLELEQLNSDKLISPEEKKNKGLGIQNQISDVLGQQQTAGVQERVKGTEAMNEEARAALQDAESLDQLADANRRNVDAMAQLVLGHEVATGAIGKHDQAVQLSAMHAQEYAAQLDELQAQRDRIQASSGLDDKQKKNATDRIDTQMATVQGAADRSAQADKWAEQSQTAFGGFISALQDITAAGKDHAAEMRAITLDLVNGVNKTIVELLTSRGSNRHLFTDLGHSLAVKGTQLALQGGESEIFGMIKAITGGHPGMGGSASELGGGSTALCRTQSVAPISSVKVSMPAGMPPMLLA